MIFNQKCIKFDKPELIKCFGPRIESFSIHIECSFVQRSFCCCHRFLHLEYINDVREIDDWQIKIWSMDKAYICAHDTTWNVNLQINGHFDVIVVALCALCISALFFKANHHPHIPTNNQRAIIHSSCGPGGVRDGDIFGRAFYDNKRNLCARVLLCFYPHLARSLFVCVCVCAAHIVYNSIDKYTHLINLWTFRFSIKIDKNQWNLMKTLLNNEILNSMFLFHEPFFLFLSFHFGLLVWKSIIKWWSRPHKYTCTNRSDRIDGYIVFWVIDLSLFVSRHIFHSPRMFYYMILFSAFIYLSYSKPEHFELFGTSI